MSDLVAVKTWFTVEIPRFYAPVVNLLLSSDEKSKWKGMRTVGQIKREQGLAAKPNKDSLYTEITREAKVFSELKVPRNLQRDLPYNLKPKVAGNRKKANIEAGRVAVILEPKERKILNQMKMLKTVHHDKQDKLEKEQTKRVEVLIRKKTQEEERKFKKQKEARKQVARAISKAEMRQHKLASRETKRKHPAD